MQNCKKKLHVICSLRHPASNKWPIKASFLSVSGAHFITAFLPDTDVMFFSLGSLCPLYGIRYKRCFFVN